ncbi:hypothetical protein [Microbacterium keratanolyticum]|uniref:hypothetical protein n=1 Tax=Microbacterium keratanolyticum TaxID=67574 RepID=UPI003633D07F
MHGDNPAGRLLAILEEVQKFQVNTPSREAWMQALKVKDNDLPQLLVRMGELMALPSLAVKQLSEKYPRQYQAGSHSHFYSQVTSALSRLDFGGTIDGFKTRVDQNAMNYLSALADLLEAKKSTDPLSGDQIAELQGKVSELMEFVRKQDISPELKQYLLDKLTRAMEAVDRYFITGSAPIIDAVESTFGHAVFNEEFRLNIKKSHWQSFASTLATIANIATIAAGVGGLTEDTVKFLENMAN